MSPAVLPAPPSRIAITVAAFACGALAWRATHERRTTSRPVPCTAILPRMPHPPGYVVASDEDMPFPVVGTVVRISDEIPGCGVVGDWRVVTFRNPDTSTTIDVVVEHAAGLGLWRRYAVGTYPVTDELLRAIEPPKPVHW